MFKLENGQIFEKKELEALLKENDMNMEDLRELCYYFENTAIYSDDVNQSTLTSFASTLETVNILKVRNKCDDDTDFLEAGYWLNRQIAEWFGVKPKTFLDKKSKYLEKLSRYCNFIPDKHGAYIYNVKEAFYRKNRNYEIIKEHFEEIWGLYQLGNEKIDTGSRVGKIIKSRYQLDCKETTAAKYVNDARTDFYGSPIHRTEGKKGSCRYVWLVFDEEHHYREITKEENKLRIALTNQIYGNIDLSDIEILIKNDELSKADVWKFIQECAEMSENGYTTVFEAFNDKTGLFLWKGTALEARAFGIFIED